MYVLLGGSVHSVRSSGGRDRTLRRYGESHPCSRCTTTAKFINNAVLHRRDAIAIAAWDVEEGITAVADNM